MNNSPFTQRKIDEASDILRNGGLVALPTETVYGLAARADDAVAVARIFTAKKRPAINPLICHVSDIGMAEKLVEIPSIARKLAANFWPGALTLVLPAKPNNRIAENVSAGLPTLAVRMPAHDGMRAIILSVGAPLAAPSANRSGRMSPTRADHVRRDMANIADLIVDGGATSYGLESTVIAVNGDEVVLLRHGAIAREVIETVLGHAITTQTTANTPSSPGQLLRHYAPNTRLILNSTAGELRLGFGGKEATLNLSQTGDLTEAAHNLFAMLQELDEIATKKSIHEIHIAPIPAHGQGAAINDRLSRAAASVAVTQS